MSTKLFKNTEGKVLMSAGGKLIKQSYEFGKAFQNRMGLNNYIKIENLNLSLIPSTELFWCFDTSSDLSESLSTRKSVSNNNYNRHAYANNTYLTKNSTATSPITPIFGSPASFIQSGLNFMAIGISSAISGFSRCNSSLSTTMTASNLVDSDTTGILIGAIKIATTDTLLPAQYSTAKFNRYVLFSRVLSDQECSYFYNNKNGNELQLAVGLEIDLHCNFAELLDFSATQNGSDMRVGCRDYSGFNRHGEIINIPGGDPETILAWANANLFVDFLS